MLEDVLQSYKELADKINWKSYDINELFFNYIKHEHDADSEYWYAGIICRVWGYSGKIYNKCNKNIPFDMCYDIVIDAVNYVISKRVWGNEDSSLFNDPAAPDKAFHVALKRQLSIVMSNLTAQKRQTNYNALSLDEAHEDFNDAAEGLLSIGDESSEHDLNSFTLIEFIKSQEPLYRVLLDQVCFNSWNTLKSVVTNIKKLTISDYNYYNTNYNITEKEFTKILNSVKILNNKIILSELKKVLYIIRKEVYSD